MYYRGLRFLDLTQLTETKEDPSPNSNGNGNSTLPNSTPLRLPCIKSFKITCGNDLKLSLLLFCNQRNLFV